MKSGVAGLALVAFLAAISAAGGIFSYRSVVSSAEADAAARRLLQVELQRLDAGLTALDRRLTALQERLPAVGGMTDSRVEGKEKIGTHLEKGLLSAEELQQLRERLASSEREVSHLWHIIESTGIGRLADINGLDPNILKELYDVRARRKHIDTWRNDLLERNRELHLTDQRQYNEELDLLYRRARLRQNRAYTEDSNLAFEALLAKYPEAYSTAMVLAERSLFSVFRNTAEAEKYYQRLKGSQSEAFRNVITDEGIEALPNIEYLLARQYLRQGRPEAADKLLGSLEENYANSLLYLRRRGIWRPAAEEIARLRGIQN